MIVETVTFYLGGAGSFLLYFFAGALLTVIYSFIYALITPQNEWTLVREGNTAAAIGIAGALIGFVLPVANAMAQSLNILDFVLWAMVAMIIQILAYLVVRIIFPRIVTRLEEGETAAATVMAAISVSAGVLNAAAMTW